MGQTKKGWHFVPKATKWSSLMTAVGQHKNLEVKYEVRAVEDKAYWVSGQRSTVPDFNVVSRTADSNSILLHPTVTFIVPQTGRVLQMEIAVTVKTERCRIL